MTMAGTVMNPSGTTGFNLEAWKRGAEESTYQRMLLIPVVDDFGGRIYGIGHVRKTQRVAGATLAQNATGEGLTYVSIIGTPVNITPVGSVVPIAWSENEDAQIDLNLDDVGRGEIEGALAELTETNVAANFQSATQIMSQAGVDATMLRQALGRLTGNTNGKGLPGGPNQIFGFFSNTQMPNLMAIEEVNRAEWRGDSENPYVKGLWVKGFGFTLMVSTVVAQDANGWHNALFLKEALVTGWNIRTRIKRQELELNNRLIIFNNMGSAVQHDLRMIALRTTASAL